MCHEKIDQFEVQKIDNFLDLQNKTQAKRTNIRNVCNTVIPVVQDAITVM